MALIDHRIKEWVIGYLKNTLAAYVPYPQEGGGGMGEIFYVAKSGSKAYAWLNERTQTGYLFTTIQAALDKTVECRNDYVYVWPDNSDYDITTVLTMSKKSVHLICPAGLGNDRGATAACRIEQTTAATAVIAVSDSSIEIAGFYLKPYIGCNHITMATTSYSPNIHHNTFVLKWTAANLPAIKGTGDACAWGSIERNWFVSQAGDDKTCASIIDIASSATAARVCYNDFMIGDGNIATVGVKNLATKGSVNYNTFAKAGSDGTYTHCIQVSQYGTAIGNRGTVADSILVVGGASNATFSDNMNAVDGGVIDDED